MRKIMKISNHFHKHWETICNGPCKPRVSLLPMTRANVVPSHLS